MAGFAIVAALDVIKRLAGCCHTVMAGKTGADNGGMIDPHDRTPRQRAVAIFAKVGCRYVGGRLATRGRSVVTTRAVAKNR